MISPVLPFGRMWRGRRAVRQTLLKLGKTIVNSRRGSLLEGSGAAGIQLLWICPLCWFPHWAGVLGGFSFHWKLKLGNSRIPKVSSVSLNYAVLAVLPSSGRTVLGDGVDVLASPVGVLGALKILWFVVSGTSQANLSFYRGWGVLGMSR